MSKPTRAAVLSTWAVLLALGALCQIALKYAGIDTGPFDFSTQAFVAATTSAWLWVAIGCYIGEFVAWMAILRHSSLSSAFPTGAIVLIVLMIASRWLFDEPLGWSKIVGSALIALGVFMLGPDQPAPTTPPSAFGTFPRAGDGKSGLSRVNPSPARRGKVAAAGRGQRGDTQSIAERIVQ
jgi:drug/metabolite transporter (DMT)-like permease